MERMEKLLAVVDQLDMNELHRVVIENRLEAVKYLLKNGADIANTIKNGQTALHIATALNYYPIMEELVKDLSKAEARKLINIRAKDSGSAVLHMAAKNNAIKSVKFLLSNGANFEVMDKENRQPIDLTTDDSVRQLLQRIKDIFELVESTTTADSEALMTKLKSCPFEDLTLIIHARNRQGYTPLQAAIISGNLEIIATIVTFKIDNLRFDWPDSYASQLDSLILHSKAARRHLSNLESFCKDNVLTSKNKKKNRMIAGYHNDINALLAGVTSLMKICKEKIDKKIINLSYLTIMNESIELLSHPGECRDQILKLKFDDFTFALKLLKLCVIAPMLLFMKSVYSLELVRAASRNNLNGVEKCLTGQPDLNKTNGTDKTALCYGFFYANIEMIKLLLDFGADPTWSGDNNTPLHIALESSKKYPPLFEKLRSSDVIKLHLDCISKDKVADYIDETDSNGLPALHTALELEDGYWLVELLLSKGATYCIKAGNGKSYNHLKISNSYSKTLLLCINEMFTLALKDPDNLMERLNKLRREMKIPAAAARNDEGYTVVQVLERNGHIDLATEIEKMMEIENKNSSCAVNEK